MATIQWRPEINALTTPQSYRILFMPRNVASREDIAADIALRHPNFSESDILTILKAEEEAIKTRLLNGEQVTKSGAFSYSLTFSGRLNSPDDPLPPLEECLHVRVNASKTLTAALRRDGKSERLPEEKKLPLISTAQDTVLGLKDVLNPQGLLQLAGADLQFDGKQGSGCVIEGTAGGKVTQTRFGKIDDREIIVMPDLPAQPHPWNNEHTVSVSTRYSERGTLRTGTYAKMLRSPLTVSGMWEATPPLTGILTDKESSAHVNVTGGSVAADETLRIQAVYNAQADALLFNLLDMQEGGAAGAAVTVAANGAVTLQGFSGSAVTSLNLWVNNYAALKEMVRIGYGGRVADVLKIETA